MAHQRKAREKGLHDQQTAQHKTQRIGQASESSGSDLAKRKAARLQAEIHKGPAQLCKPDPT